MNGIPLWTAVVSRLLANPVSNALQKSLGRKGLGAPAMVFVVHLWLTAACLPLLALVDLPVGSVFWTNMLVAAALAVLCNTLLIAALRDDDLSLLGPVNSFKPLVSLPAAFVLLGELPGPVATAGIGLVVLGSYGLMSPANAATVGAPWRTLLSRRGVRLRVAALVVSAVEAVFLKRALLAAAPLATFIWWSILGCICAGAWLVVGRRLAPWGAAWEATRRYRLRVAALAASTGLMQYSTLVVFVAAPVASALALFQLSSIISVILGHRLFGEPHVVRRLIASTIMAAGAALITLDR